MRRCVCWNVPKVSPTRGAEVPPSFRRRDAEWHCVNVRVRGYQRVQQHGMTTGSLILPRGSCMPPNGITPPRVIACECADILATMGAR